MAAVMAPFLARRLPDPGAAAAQSGQLGFQGVDPAADVAAVAFQLAFAGAPGADAAAQSGQLLAKAGKPGQAVLLLGQLHLDAALPGAGPTSEDV